MALYGGQRDISLFRHVNRELIGNIISQQCAYYKFKIDETKVNLYGEAAGAKYYYPPVLLSALIDHQDEEYPDDEFGVRYYQNVDFKFLRDDLVDAEVVPEVGDIILYEEGYYEVDDVITNQLFVGKDPRYPNKPNPFENDLDKFGYDVSIICKTHSVPSDKVGISRERLI